MEAGLNLVLQGDIVLPDRVLSGHLAIKGEKIVSLGEGSGPAAKVTETFKNCLLFPGIVDGQVHAGSCEGFPGLQDATRAAAAGGVTTIIDMPFDDPIPINTLDLFNQKHDGVAWRSKPSWAIVATGQAVAVGMLPTLLTPMPFRYPQVTKMK